jgi:hypothetical protein
VADVIREHLDCQCENLRHTVRFTLDPNDGGLYLDTHLTHYDSFWKRLWNALRYLWGADVRDGHFDTTLIRPADHGRIRQLLSESERLRAEFLARGATPP